MRFFVHVLITLSALSLIQDSRPAEAAQYFGGQVRIQNNSFVDPVRTFVPPADHLYNENGFYGVTYTRVLANRGRLLVKAGSYKQQPVYYGAFGSFRFDDVVFRCGDGRSNVTYQLNLDVRAEVTGTGSLPDDIADAKFTVGDPTAAYGSSSNQWGGWTWTNGGSGVLSGIPAGLSVAQTHLTGPSRTVSTEEEVSLTVSARSIGQSKDRSYVWMNLWADLPTDGPIFELPVGCTCDSPEGDIIDNRFVPYGIIKAVPNYGGDGGVATVVVVGTGFEDGAEVRLTGNGAPILGQVVSVNDVGTRIKARFDLSGAPQGFWNVEVQNTTADTVVKNDAFEIQAAEPVRLTVSTSIGHGNRILSNTPSPMVVSVTNQGNNDALIVPLLLDGLPLGSTLEARSELLLPDPPSAEPETLTLELDGGLSASFIVPRIAPGQTRTLSLRLGVPEAGAYAMRVRAVGALLDPQATTSGSLGKNSGCADAWNCIVGGAGRLASCIGPFLPDDAPAECAVAIANLLLNQAGSICSLIEAGSEGDLDDLFWPLYNWLNSWLSNIPSVATGCGADFDVRDWLSRANRYVGVLNCVWGILYDSDTAEACCNWFLGVECGPITPVDFFVVNSFDPNEKTGSATPSSRSYIAQGAPIDYTIFFENLSSATAPAHVVELHDELPTSLDPATMTWGPIRFGAREITPDPFRPLREVVDLRPDSDIVVSIAGDLEGHTLRWKFTSLNPDTGLPISDPLVGFLPPNASPPEGEGSVSLTIYPSAGLPTDTAIENEASIVFDNNSPIETNAVVHRIDIDSPSTSVEPLPAVSQDTLITLQVVGSDVGAGIQDYVILVSEDSGAYDGVGSYSLGEIASFVGKRGHTYDFYSVARDSAGNVEQLPAQPDASTQIAGGVPVLFSLFEVESRGRNVELRWRISNVELQATTHVERRASEDGPWQIVDLFTEERGDVTVALDQEVEPEMQLSYRLAVRFESGSTEYSQTMRVATAPEESVFALRTLSSNPTTGTVRVEFELPSPQSVDVRVFDVRGREVATLAKGRHGKGRWQAAWPTLQGDRHIPAGVYFVRLHAGGRMLVRRVVLLHR